MAGRTQFVFFPYLIQGGYGGIERNIIALAHYVADRGGRVQLVCYFDEIGMAKMSQGTMDVVELGRTNNQWTKATRLARYLKAHAAESDGLPLFFGIKGGFNAGIADPGPHVLHFTDPPSLLSGGNVSNHPLARIKRTVREKLAHFLTRRGTRRARKVLTMSRRNAAELHDLYGVSSDIILQGGVPPAGELAPKPASDGAFGILSVCRVTKSKRLDWVLEGLAKLRGEEGWPAGFRPILEIVGEGPEEAGLKLLAERLGLSDFVKFRGFVSAQELEECYRRAHLFVMPAIQGYGLPALEALYRRVPVLMHSDSGVSEIFDHNPWAEIVSGGPQDYANAFVHAVRRILTSPPSIEEFPHLPTEEGWAAEIVRQCDWKLPQP